MTKKDETPKYRSPLSAAIHESVEDLHRIGLIDRTTMREFDASCLTSVEPLSAKQIAVYRRATPRRG
jgi:putative transcriptional regulator